MSVRFICSGEQIKVRKKESLRGLAVLRGSGCNVEYAEVKSEN